MINPMNMPEAMADTPSTSGEGVDVLSLIRNTIASNGWQARERDEAHKRIAELIEAAADLEHNVITGERLARLYTAARACRATPGTHR